MTSVNIGSQFVFWDYKHPANSDEFNRLLRHLIKPGIYKGGALSYTGNIIHVQPFEAFVNAVFGSDDNLGIHLQTQSQADITVVNITLGVSEYLYIDFEWLNVLENYAEFKTRKTTDSAIPNEIIIGTITYDGAGNVTGVTDAGRSRGLFDETDDVYFENDIRVRGSGDYYDTLRTSTTAARTYTFPDKSMTVGDQSDIDQFEQLIISNTNYLKNRINSADQKILDLQIQNAYILNRESTSSDYLLETFMSDSQTNLTSETSSTKTAEVMDDNEWNDNWKQRDGIPDFKNGFLRPQKQPYMLEVIDEYNLVDVGQSMKGAISQWDSTNNCYWMISCGGANTLGEITKLSQNMKNGQVEVMSNYYIPAGGASTFWQGIDSAGDRLFFIKCDTGTVDSSVLYSIKINTDGTLGEVGYEVANGQTIDLTNSIENSRGQSGAGNDVGYYNDVIIYDASDVYVLTCSASSGACNLLSINQSSLGSGTASDIIDFEYYIGGSLGWGYAATKYGDNVYIIQNDNTDDERFIHKFDLTTDIVSNKPIKSSGRFDTTRNFDTDGEVNIGITVSNTGDVLEVVNTTSNGKFISKRALKNALWAENQVDGEVSCYVFDSTNLPTTPFACTVESNRYYWTGDNLVTADQVDVFRYDTQAGTTLYGRLTGASWTRLRDLTTDGTTLWLLGSDGTNYEVYFGSLSSFVALMSTFGTTIDITSWGTLATGIGASNTIPLNGITHDNDNSVLYIANNFNDKIDTLSEDGTTWNTGVYDLPPAISEWYGISYKNNNIYIQNYTTTTTPNKIYVLNISKSTSSVWYREHVYQDSSREFTYPGNAGFDFHGNNLVFIHTNTFKFNITKTLEDPDVLQLHSFLDSSNVLVSDNVSCSTPIVKRYFEPEDFSDVRNVPDKNYMGAGYGDNGFSLLHLDEFLSERTSTGQPRYTPSKIRVQDYLEGSANNLINAVAHVTTTLLIEKDIILVGSNGSTVKIIDLKKGTSILLNSSTNSGYYYTGSLSERNDGSGYSGSYNTGLNISNTTQYKVFARTFTKDDSSDFLGENPKTFVLIGTPSGCDLLEIDWDSGNSRTPVRVWNNIANDASGGEFGSWISPSGKIFLGDYASSGTIYEMDDYVWNIKADSSGNSKTSVGTIGGFVTDISPNSRCWKTASGEWRHQILACTYENAGSGDVYLALLDVENSIQETVFLQNSGATVYMNSCDLFEDIIFAAYYTSASIKGLSIFKKLYFDSLTDTRILNNWKSMYSYQFSYDYTILATDRPVFVNSVIGTGTNGAKFVRYSTEHRNLIYCDGDYGLQIFHFPELSDCTHESIVKDLSVNPGKYNYVQNTILPE